MTSIPERPQTDHPRGVIEATLADVVGNRVAAYVRSDLVERRLVLIDDWEGYLARRTVKDGTR